MSVAPVGLIALKDSIGIQSYESVKTGRFETFEVDFSAWRLNLTAVNPAVWIKAHNLALVKPAVLAAELQAVVRERGWLNSHVLLFADGATGGLAQHLPEERPQFVLFDEAEQGALQTVVSPRETMITLLRKKISLLHLSPYEASQPVISGRFFGRQSEINKVIDNPQTSYLFVGIRRIGKTSLLKEIQRQLDLVDPPQEGQIRRVYVDCTVISSEDEFLRTLLFPLQQSQLSLITDTAALVQLDPAQIFEHYTLLHGQPITFLLDEFDRLIPRMQLDWQLLKMLQTAVMSHKIRFIAAGFRQATRAFTEPLFPFFNLLTPIRLGRLPLADIQEMVLTPMAQLGIVVQDQKSFIQQLSRETAGLPNYVQHYCKILLAHLKQTERTTLSVDDLQIVHKCETFRHFVLNTFMSNTALLERALVYAIVAEGDRVARGQFNENRLLRFLEKRKLQVSYESVDVACRQLEVAGLFNRVGADYEFAVPLFQSMLRQTRDVSFLFERTREALQTENSLTY